MTLEQTPAPARSDVPRTSPARIGGPARRPYLREGALLTVGALTWALSMAVGGINPADDTWEHTFHGVGSGLFQLGVMALLTVLWRTRALGDGRLARFLLRVEAVILTLAFVSTVGYTTGIEDIDSTLWILLDICWPLSMLGMFLVGIRIAIHGRWKGVARFWPMVAESWAVVTVPTMGIFGESVADVVGPLHLVVGYAVLGVVVARKVG